MFSVTGELVRFHLAQILLIKISNILLSQQTIAVTVQLWLEPYFEMSEVDVVNYQSVYFIIFFVESPFPQSRPVQ